MARKSKNKTKKNKSISMLKSQFTSSAASVFEKDQYNKLYNIERHYIKLEDKPVTKVRDVELTKAELALIGMLSKDFKGRAIDIAMETRAERQAQKPAGKSGAVSEGRKQDGQGAPEAIDKPKKEKPPREFGAVYETSKGWNI